MGILYLVATPIGNLEDITLRAIKTLQSADVIACEDTRHSRPLMAKYGVNAPLISYHKFNERAESQKIVQMLNDGKNIALISDAGMPCISDPGAILVNEVRASGNRIEVIPGACAFVSAAALCGVIGAFTFYGFVPDKPKDKKSLYATLKAATTTSIFYLSPHSLVDELTKMGEAIGDRKVYLARELTKMYEEVLTTTLLTAGQLGEPRGEYVVVMPPMEENRDYRSVEEHLTELIELGIDKKDAIKQVAKERGLDKNAVYQTALRLGIK